MDKHTFKVGDRVIVYTGLKYDCVEGQRGFIRERNCEAGVRVSFDNGKYNRIGEDIWYVHNNNLTHDTDFQVGDWVRYEGIHPRVVSPLLEGKIGQIDYLSGDSCAGISQFHMQSGGIVYKENLVKIQPPQKDSDNTIVHVFTSYTDKGEKNMRNVFGITHEKYGVVQGVHQVAPGCYCKNGAYYYQGEGWRETEEWVKIEVRKSQWDNVNKCCNILEVQKKSEDYPDTCTISWRSPQ